MIDASVLSRLPASGSRTAAALALRSIQGVPYWQAQIANGGDLFLTGFGWPFAAQLQPDNWLSAPWFEAHRRRLRGTSCIYKTHTKPVDGLSLELVVRFSRVGEDIPADTATRSQCTHAAFNSPFEEVAQVMALRGTGFGTPARRIATKRPLAIYSPPTRLQPWQTGRSESQMAVKQAALPEIELDILRQYIVVYGWIQGLDVKDAADHLGLGGAAREALLTGVMEEVEADLRSAGFRELDMKPEHIVIRLTRDGRLLRRKDGRLVYALVDYELLEPIS